MTSQSSLRLWRGSLILTAMILVVMGGAQVRAACRQDPPAAPTPVPDGAGPQDAPGSSPDQTDSQGGQVLTRGAVHEAYAAPVVHDPAPSPVVPKEPPSPIQEMPPDQKPAGQNVQWIPGYWSWDVSRDDFIWISGIWREPPPNSQWVPGYWHQVEGGSQWVPGTWIPISSGPAQSQPSYLPAPPKSLEAGPNTPAPAPNLSWTPGYWSWQGSGYAWRPGFWAAVQSNWIWMPAHYVWTPSGHLFVAGYWDLPLANRGLMFAPVYYPQPVYAQPNFVFTPSISIVGSAVTANLFVQASTNQYLFGNYYRPELRERRHHSLVFLHDCQWPAGLLRPSLLVLRGDQRAAEPRLGDPDSRAVHSKARERGPQAAGHLHRADTLDREERHDRSQRHGGGPSHAGDAAQQAGGRSGGREGHASGAGPRSGARADPSASGANAPVSRTAAAAGARGCPRAGGRRCRRGPPTADEPASFPGRIAPRRPPGRIECVSRSARAGATRSRRPR